MFASKHVIVFITLILLLLVIISSCHNKLYKGAPSDHFDGRRFYNEEPDHTFWDRVKWLWKMDTVDWPKWIEDPPHPKPTEYVNHRNIKVTFINHATILIQMDGLNILTDPIWSERAGPVSWMGSKRVRAPGVPLKDMPKIDAILISHDHYDHLDVPSLKQLSAQFQPLLLIGLGGKSFLKSKGFSNIIEMDWWQTYLHQSAGVTFTFVPARHSSGRGLWGRNRVLWGGFVIEGAAGRVYFAGDTGYGQFLQSIHERFRDFRLTIFPIGNYEPRWFMKAQHMNPEDAVEAHLLLNSQQSLGIHFGTFVEHPEQAIDAHEKKLSEALKKYNMSSSKFWVLQFGEGREVSR